MTILVEQCLQRLCVESMCDCKAQGSLQQATKKNKCIFSTFKFMIWVSKAENCVGGDTHIENGYKCSPCYRFNHDTTVKSSIKPLIKITEMHLHGAQKEA